MAKKNPYQQYDRQDMLMRDHLALDRTRLANERTLLAYLRSGVALILAGVSFIYFARTSWLEGVGAVCIPVGIVTLAFGLWRFAVTERRLRGIGDGTSDTG